MAKSGAPEYTHRRLMRSVRIMLRVLVRFRVPKRCCQSVSEDQGRVVEKKRLSRSRAPSHVIPSFRSLVAGCFTVNHPFVRFSASPLMNRNQRPSSPEGIRSGFVRTPTWDRQQISPDESQETGFHKPIVRSPSGSCCFAIRWAPWFSKSAAWEVNTKAADSVPRNLLSHVTVRRIKQLGLRT